MAEVTYTYPIEMLLLIDKTAMAVVVQRVERKSRTLTHQHREHHELV